MLRKHPKLNGSTASTSFYRQAYDSAASVNGSTASVMVLPPGLRFYLWEDKDEEYLLIYLKDLLVFLILILCIPNPSSI